MPISEMTPVPVILVSGFLGAGKTTLMRHLIMDAHRRELKTAVIVNEFGVADIDSTLLQDAELIESVSGGCACCTGQDDFVEALVDVGERRGAARPDVVLVEASGLADPLLMLDCLTIAHLLPLLRLGALLTVVDHSRFALIRSEVMPLLVRQLQLANFIILNKIDISFEPQHQRASIDTLRAQLQKLSPEATIVPAKGCAVDLDPVWETVECKRSLEALSAASAPAPHFHYQTVTCPMPRPVQRAWFEATVQKLDPAIWRAKGFLHIEGEKEMFLFQYAAGANGAQYHLEPFRFRRGVQPPAASLVFIGPALDRAQILRDFGGHTLLNVL